MTDQTVTSPADNSETTRPSLYASRQQIYPRKVAGRFRRIKWTALTILLADLPNARAYFFFIEIWPQEIYYLTGLLVLAAVGLFLATSMAGRVWCGYTCPQTVWTDLFMWVERLVEGDRNARMRLDKQHYSLKKAVRKVSKHAIWLAISFLTGGAWSLYFVDAPTLLSQFFVGESSSVVYGSVIVLTSTTYLLAGMAREQVCTYMCPWPRFQTAMFDEDTLVVTYQKWRGEPRGKKPKAGESWEGHGDCIDCLACVHVCPTGIDIRDGVQLECISCALCIDACNDVMAKIGRPGSLITYDTEANQKALEQGGSRPKYKILRLRTLLYAMLFVGISVLLLYQLLVRDTLDITVFRDRNPLFVTLSNGDLRNGYTVKLVNKTREPRTFNLSYRGLPDSKMRIVGQASQDDGKIALSAAADSVVSYQVYVSAARDAVSKEITTVFFQLTDPDKGETVVHESVFRGPGR